MSKVSCLSRASWLVLGLMCGAAPTMVAAQQAEPAPAAVPAATPAPAPGVSTAAVSADEDDKDAIVVQGIRLRGSVEGDIKPEVTLTQADVQARGASNVGELISALSAEIGATGGAQPVTLLNGKRISSMMEIFDIPSEAISRSEILPPEVALNYGYPADQRVINIVLVPSYKAVAAQGGFSIATRGGRESPSANVSLQTIAGDNRLNITLDARAADELRESERDITPIGTFPQSLLGGNIYGNPAGSQFNLAGTLVTNVQAPDSAANGAQPLSAFIPGANSLVVPDLGAYRTLQPRTRQYSANVTLTRALGGVSASVNARLQRNESQSLQGLSTSFTNNSNSYLLLPVGSPFSPFSQDVLLYRYYPEFGALKQNNRTTTAHLGVTLFGPIAGGWNWNFTGNYDRNINKTFTNRGADTTDLQARITARDPSVNPFGPIAASLLPPRSLDTGDSRSNALDANLNITGSPFRLPAVRCG